MILMPIGLQEESNIMSCHPRLRRGDPTQAGMTKFGYLFAGLIVIFAALLLAAIQPVSASDDSGTFRGKWWNYYERGLESSERGELDSAMSDLIKARSMRNNDQRMARTYGMHFIDYFPHREIGIIHLANGNIEESIKELEESVRHEESAKAVFYLNRARRLMLERSGKSVDKPVLTVGSPSAGLVVKGLSVKVSGHATGAGYISRITINGEPYRFDLSGQTVSFDKELLLVDGQDRIVISCEDLLGNKAEVIREIRVDREGPGISISEIRAEDKNGERFIRISGEINDDTGIKMVRIGDDQRVVNGLRDYKFDMILSRAKVGERIIITALDVLDNETVAEIDVEKDLSAFSRRPAPILLAFNAPGVLSFDKEPPVIKLKEVGVPQTVFVDRYFVEGEAFDNKKVEKVLINGREIPSPKGKKVFFSSMVKLNEGNNRIVVEAVDGSGNRSASEISVKREVPSVMQIGSRLNITVLLFDSKQKNEGYSDLAYDHLIGSFVDQKRFKVIERAKLEQVLSEQKLAKAKLTDPDNSIKIGRIMSANAIVATSVREDRKSIEIVSRVINTETSEVMDVKDVFTEDKGMGAVKELMDGLAAKIANSFPLAEGMVLKRDGGVLFTDIGNKAKIKKDAPVIIYRRGKEVKHPVTGKSMGFDTVKLAEGRIEDVQEDFSKARLLEKPAPSEIREKDLIITK